MSERLRVLCVEDSADDAALILREIGKHGFEVELCRVESAETLQEALGKGDWDIVLSDFNLPRFNGLAALDMVRRANADLPFVVVSGAIGEETAVQLMRAGANDYVWKDKLARLGPVVRRELNDADIRRKRREAEAALKLALEAADAERSKIASIIRSVPDGLLVCDEQDRVILMNRVAAELLELSTAEVINQPLSTVFDDSYLRSQLRALLERPIGDHREQDLQIPLPGCPYPRVIQARSSTMTGSSGAPMGTVTILRDITRERELDRMKTEFISTAAHELSTPLTSVIGYAELLLNQADIGGFTPGQQREFLEEILRKSTVLGSLVDEMLDISRIEAGQGMVLRKQPCNLKRAIEQEVCHFRMQSPRHTFEVEFPDAVPQTFLLDPNKMDAVMENLLSNAVKYSPAGGTIRVTARVSGDALLCTVADEGIGLTAEQARKVFDKFYRVDASNTAVKGLGLGLGIVRQIIESHGGRVWLESEPGKGTKATFTLPLPDLHESVPSA